MKETNFTLEAKHKHRELRLYSPHIGGPIGYLIVLSHILAAMSCSSLPTASA